MSKLKELIDKLCPNGVTYKPLNEFCDFERGKGFKKEDIGAGNDPIIFYGELYTTYGNYIDKIVSTTDVAKVKKATIVNNNDIVLPISSTTSEAQIGKASVVKIDNVILGSDAIVIRHNINASYLMYYLNSKIFEYYKMKCVAGTTIRHLSPNDMMKIRVAIPPLDVQSEIVRILDNYTELTAKLTEELSLELKARKKQYDFYFKQIMFNKSYPVVKIEDVGQVKMCKRILKSQTNTEGGIPFYKIGTFGKEPDAYISKEIFDEYVKKYSYPKKGDILISCSGTIGRTVIFDGEPAYFQDSNIVWLEHSEEKILNEYLKYCYMMSPWKIATGGTIARLYNDNILKAEIPLPNIDEQRKIIKILSDFENISNEVLLNLSAEIEKRKKQYEYYRNQLLSFKEVEINE